MINNNKAYHVSNLYEEKLNRSSKKPTHNNNPSFKNSISSQNPKSKRTENSLGIVYTEPSPYEDPEKILKYKGIPNSHPLEKPCKDLNNFDDFTTPTENPAYFLKEKEKVVSQKNIRNTSIEVREKNKFSKNDEKTLNKVISFNNLKDPDSSNLLQENNRLSSELNSLKTKIRDYESIQEELETFQNENKSLKSEIIVLQCKQQKENEFNEILKEFETNFRKKILEVESEKEYYKGLNKQYLIEKNNIKLEKEEKIYELEFLIGELTKNLKEKEENLILIQKKPQFKNSFVHETKFTELKEENNKILIDLQEKNLEVGVWKEKFYELLDEKNKNEKEKFTNNINDQSNSKYFQTISQQNLEINSMRIQIKEMAEKMEILNRIIESKCEEKENLEIELNVYKKKFQELEKKTKDSENFKSSSVLWKEKDESEILKKKNVENEKKILTLISEFEKLSNISSKLEEENILKENVIQELRIKLTEKLRNSKGFNINNSEVFSEKNKEKDRTIKTLENQVENLRMELKTRNSNGMKKKEGNKEIMYAHAEENINFENELKSIKNEVSAKNKELAKCFDIINEQNTTIKKLTELGDFKQSVCWPSSSENKINYSFGEDENIEKEKYLNNEYKDSNKLNIKISGVNLDNTDRLGSNRAFFVSEDNKKYNIETNIRNSNLSEFEDYSKPVKFN